MSYFPPAKRTYRRVFTNSDLSGGTITIDHNLSEDYPVVIVYNDDREVVIPNGILSLDQNSLYVDLSGFGNIIGNWCIVVGK
jgi:hypothetical protein